MTSLVKAPPLPRVVVAGGVALFWVVQLTLLFVSGLPLVDTILIAVLLVGVPALSIAQLPLIQNAFVERLPAYWGSIATLWLLGSACWLVGTRVDGATAIGVIAQAPGAMVVWSVGLTGAGLGIIFFFRQIAIRAGVPDSPMLRQLLPRTRHERRVFALLSVAAGVGEEVAYRGYAIPVLTPVFGVTGAAVVTSVVFGAVHGYQGALGVLRTGTMGGVLAWGFISSGSLVPVMIAHTLIDLIAGIALGERLLSPRAMAGVDEGPDLGTSPSRTWN